MEAVHSSETLMNFHQNTQHHMPEDFIVTAARTSDVTRKRIFTF
jgi:hypothetical protein